VDARVEEGQRGRAGGSRYSPLSFFFLFRLPLSLSQTVEESGVRGGIRVYRGPPFFPFFSPARSFFFLFPTSSERHSAMRSRTSRRTSAFFPPLLSASPPPSLASPTCAPRRRTSMRRRVLVPPNYARQADGTLREGSIFFFLFQAFSPLVPACFQSTRRSGVSSRYMFFR